MLGVSNVILEETRTIHDTRMITEQHEDITDSNLNEDAIYLDESE